MKNIAILLSVVALVVIAYVQFKKHRRFSPPNEYDYVAKTDQIDANYHNQLLVTEYFETCYKIGNFARQTWYNEDIDVLTEDREVPQSTNATATYTRLRTRVGALEIRFKESKRLKSLGFDNSAIKIIEEKGLSEKNFVAFQLLNGKKIIKGQDDATVWELQKLLIAKGLSVKLDGVYNDETMNAIKEFQQKNTLYPSGIADETTINLLLKK